MLLVLSKRQWDICGTTFVAPRGWMVHPCGPDSPRLEQSAKKFGWSTIGLTRARKPFSMHACLTNHVDFAGERLEMGLDLSLHI